MLPSCFFAEFHELVICSTDRHFGNLAARCPGSDFMLFSVKNYLELVFGLSKFYPVAPSCAFFLIFASVGHFGLFRMLFVAQP